MTHLTKEQRYTISVLKKEKDSNKKAAKAIGKSESIILYTIAPKRLNTLLTMHNRAMK